MKVYNVEITNEALADMEHIYVYVATRLSAPEHVLQERFKAKSLSQDLWMVSGE